MDQIKVWDLETALARALNEWKNAGGPVMSVIDSLTKLLEERATPNPQGNDK
jgi:hypothetical protein